MISVWVPRRREQMHGPLIDSSYVAFRVVSPGQQIGIAAISVYNARAMNWAQHAQHECPHASRFCQNRFGGIRMLIRMLLSSGQQNPTLWPDRSWILENVHHTPAHVTSFV